MRPFRLTVLFAITGAVVFAAAGAVVYSAFGRIATDNIVQSAERDTERALSYLLSETVARVADPADSDLELETLSVPEGLPQAFAQATRDLGFVAAVLYAPDGAVVWATEQRGGGPAELRSTVVTIANAGGATPWLAGTPEVLDVGGTLRRFDAVSAYVPVRSGPTGPVIGILQAHRDITDDLALQSARSRSAVLRATAGTMGGLFTALLGFVFVADRSQSRSGRRRPAEGRNGNAYLTQEDRALARKEAHARQVVEAVVDGVITLDAAGVISGWDQRAEALLGRPASEAVGRPVGEMFVPSAVVNRLCSALPDSPASGTRPAAERSVDATGLHRDGRLVPVELSVARASVDGDAVRLVILRDITRRRQVEDGLQRTAFENAVLADLGVTAGGSLDIREMLGGVAVRMFELFPADRIAFGIVDQGSGTVVLEHVSGIEIRGFDRGAVASLSGSPVEESARTGHAVLLDAVAMEARGVRDRAIAADLSAGIRSELVLAITRGEDLVASLVLCSTAADAFAHRDVLLAERAAVQLSGPIASALHH
ncbi:MAG: PAS domain S-box protein, partial [Chloroflexi bacterium]|nr:PAS domain S-box protein [Chloroflexota bacterium]